MTDSTAALLYKNKPYRLLAFDLDGTLLDSDGSIHENNLHALARIRALKIPLVIATGRIYPGARHFAEQIDPDAPIISMNGAYITAGTQLIHKAEIPAGLCIEAASYLQQEGVYWHVYLENSLIATRLAHGALYYHNLNKTLPPDRALPIHIPDDPVESLKALDQGIMKFIVMSEDHRILDQAASLFRQHGLSITSSWSDNFEVMAHGINKGSGLVKVCTFLGIRPDECIAFGDNLNDLELLQTAGLSVAMDNAIPELKAAADLTAQHHNKGGVGLLLEELFSNQLHT
ncbi:MAG: HAD family phosphatase [Spirochaetales bacterium]|nr:HAD family phosphatase [Spirochaetales bacterium]